MARYMVIDLSGTFEGITIVEDESSEESALREARVRISELAESNHLSVGDVEAAELYLVEVKGVYSPETTHTYNLSGVWSI